MNMDNGSLKVKRSDEAIWRVIDGEVVILIPHQSALHALSGCGGRIWELIEDEISVPELVETICAEYEVEPEKAKNDLVEYIDKLEELNLVEKIPGKVKEKIN
jgi:hypothetical protein